jgi:protein O-GlcNAc transferase
VNTLDLPAILSQARESHARGDLNTAVRLYRSVLRAAPPHPVANYLLAVALYQAGDMRRSVQFFDAATAANPGDLAAHRDRGLVLLKLKEHVAAEASFRNALRLDPRNAEMHVNRGIALNALGRAEEAARSHREALALRPDFPEAHHNLGNSLRAQGLLAEALSHFERATGLNQRYIEAWFGVALVLLELKRGPDALRALQAVLAVDPDHIEALLARGNIRESEGERANALTDYDRVLTIDPGHIEALLQKADLLRREKRVDETFALYDKAIALAPGKATAYHGIGRSFYDKKEYRQAAASFDAAIEHEPDAAVHHYWRGRSLVPISYEYQALSSFEKAIVLQPDFVRAYVSAAFIYSENGRSEEAAAALENVRRLMPGEDRYLGLRFIEWMKMCQWADAGETLAEIVRRIEEGQATIDPLSALHHLDSPKLQMRFAELRAAKMETYSLARNKPALITRDRRMVIGYYSGDFRNHPMMVLNSELFELHDKERFRLVAFSFKEALGNERRTRVVPCFDAFHDVDHLLDREIIDLSRQENIHVAIDLMGYTRYSRTTAFMTGLAPIQVNKQGFPGTMGAGCMDYIIADPVLIPEDMRAFYSEKVAYLPNSYQPNDRKRRISERIFTREELGLPASAFVFCCFNQNFKMSPDVFAGWMRILKQAPGSVLWLLANSKAVSKNLREAAELHGVDADRLIFASRLPLDEHLARHRAADLFLDTLPYKAHTTASDALWAGLPVLTRMGQTFASRVAASLLTAA